MLPDALEYKARYYLLKDTAQRDLVTARRDCLLKLLWHERFLTRVQLIIRVEALEAAGIEYLIGGALAAWAWGNLGLPWI